MTISLSSKEFVLKPAGRKFRHEEYDISRILNTQKSNHQELVGQITPKFHVVSRNSIGPVEECRGLLQSKDKNMKMTIYSESSPAKLRWDFYGKHASSFKTLMLISSKRFSFQVKYTGYRDRSHEERIVRFQTEARDGSAIIVSPMDTLLYSLWSSTFFRTTSSCTYVTHHKSQWFLPTPFFFYLSQSFVSSGTNLNLHFAKGEDGVVTREYLDFDKEPGKVGVGKIREISWVYQWWNNSVREEGFGLGRVRLKCEGIWIFLFNIGNNVSVIVFIST